MVVYIVRRLVAAFFILIGASFIVYMLMTKAGDPLAFTLQITNPAQRAAVTRTVVETLSLDQSPIERYFDWLRRLLFEGDFGLVSVTQQPVWDELKVRMPMTLKLVGAATVMSILVGVSVGIVTALRQYSGFDYLVTFFTFVFFSLPVFWVAVILKAWGGINFNDWLRDGAHFSVSFIVVVAVVAAVIGFSFAGGRWPRRVLLRRSDGRPPWPSCSSWISSHQWLLDPGFGPVVFALIAVAIAVGTIAVMAGWRNVRVRYTALITAGIGIVAYFPLQSLFDRDVSIWIIFVLARERGGRRRHRRVRRRRLRQGAVGAHRRDHRAS